VRGGAGESRTREMWAEEGLGEGREKRLKEEVVECQFGGLQRAIRRVVAHLRLVGYLDAFLMMFLFYP
jgi:hypothetical protein